MAALQDHAYIKICSEIASRLSISIASARKKVDLVAAKTGAKSLEERKNLAKQILEKVELEEKEGELSSAKNFDQLLVALAEEENFMTED